MGSKYAIVVFILFGVTIIQGFRRRDRDMDNRFNGKFMSDFRPFDFSEPVIQFPPIKLPKIPKIEVPEMKFPDVEKMKCKPGSSCHGVAVVTYESNVNGAKEQGGQLVVNVNGKVNKQTIGE